MKPQTTTQAKRDSKQTNIPSIALSQECGFGREEQGDDRQGNPWRAVVRLLLLKAAAAEGNGAVSRWG